MSETPSYFHTKTDGRDKETPVTFYYFKGFNDVFAK